MHLPAVPGHERRGHRSGDGGRGERATGHAPPTRRRRCRRRPPASPLPAPRPAAQRTANWRAVPPLLRGHKQTFGYLPTAIVENVMGALVTRGGQCAAAARFATDLKALGYTSVAWGVMDMEECGFPQSRCRVIIVASDEVNAAEMLFGSPGACGRGDVHDAGWEEGAAAERGAAHRVAQGAPGSPSVQVINLSNAAR